MFRFCLTNQVFDADLVQCRACRSGEPERCALKEATPADLSDDINWYLNRGCEYYVSDTDTIFVCNKRQVYVQSRADGPIKSVESLNNIYDPAKYGFNGIIEKVFLGAGLSSNLIYILESKTDWQTYEKTFITLELNLGTSEIRPIFSLPSTIKTDWFHISSSGNWMVLFRESDQFFAVIQIDLQASDYKTGAAS